MFSKYYFFCHLQMVHSTVQIFCNDFKVSESWEPLVKKLVQVYIVELGPADIAAIQQLYGPKTSKTLTTRFFPTLKCKDFDKKIYVSSSTPSPSLSPPAWLNRPWLSNSQVKQKYSVKTNNNTFFVSVLFLSFFFKNQFWPAWSEVSLSILYWQTPEAKTFGHIQSCANFGSQLDQIWDKKRIK